MPRNAIDRSNTIFYKIVCKDPSIQDFHIGYTTNIVKRKCQHKTNCQTTDVLPIYKTIRNNGGWNNWSMFEICRHACSDKNEVLKKEIQLRGEHLQELKTTSAPYNSPDLITQIMKENESLKEMLKEMMKTNAQMNVANTNTNCNNTMTNCNNKSFNLNFYLNETCKDAVNIEDFVSSIKVTLEDLERTGRDGYVEAITGIAIKNLNGYEETFRPFHCGDFKREVMYVKTNNEWTKESESKPILTKAVKAIAKQNSNQIQKFQQKYPDCMEYNSKKNNLYLKIVSNAMNGSTDEECKQNIEKVIHNLAKETIIDKKAAIR